MTTPDKIYATVLSGHVTMAWSDWREDNMDVEYIRADIHDAQIDALKAENAALHAECDRLTAMLGLQKPMSAEEVTQPGFYQWRHMDGEQWTVTEVVVNEAHELRQYYFGSEENLELVGQFIGPIKMTEVQG